MVVLLLPRSRSRGGRSKRGWGIGQLCRRVFWFAPLFFPRRAKKDKKHTKRHKGKGARTKTHIETLRSSKQHDAINAKARTRVK